MIINKEGKLFGKISIVDIAVVLIVILLAIGIYTRFSGNTKVVVSNVEEHDSVIAFTSQLAHVVSNAYVKSPEAEVHSGFSAGSYLDLTRVAKLNPTMWTELFLCNKENLAAEIDGLIENLQKYSKAIKDSDADTLYALLKAGSDRKEQIDGAKSK